MEMTEIRREPIEQCAEECSSIAELAQAAEDVLGYSVLQRMTKKKEAPNSLTPLQIALKSIDIDILNAEDVKRYQRERIIEETIVKVKEWLDAAKADGDIPSGFSGPVWHREKIKEYSQPVPEFVLAKAVQIKKAFPDCQIIVESLLQHPDPFLVVEIPNPRYEWMPGDERYYVEVWAEPKFEGRLLDIEDVSF